MHLNFYKHVKTPNMSKTPNAGVNSTYKCYSIFLYCIKQMKNFMWGYAIKSQPLFNIKQQSRYSTERIHEKFGLSPTTTL